MRKISSYLYPNRIQLLADLAGFTTEYTNVYQRNVKIYKGVDNVLEFDIKNADQKRIELNTTPDITDITLNVMDASGNGVGTYMLDPTATKGIATVTIPSTDISGLDVQFLKYSVTATQGTNVIPLYADSRFGATGTLELVGDAMPVTRAPRVFKDFTAEIDLEGLPISRSSAIPATFYEAEKTTTLDFEIFYTGFKGKIWIEATTASTIAAESFKPEVKLHEFPELTVATSGTFTVTMDVNDYKYFRIRYTNASKNDVTANNLAGLTGTVDKVIVS